MPHKAPCLKVPKALGEKSLHLAKRLTVFNRELKVQQVGDNLYIPLVEEPSTAQTREIRSTLPEGKISVCAFPLRKRHASTLIDALEDKLPPYLLASLPRSLDFVGEIAVVEVPPELKRYKEALGEAVLKVHKQVQTVLAKSGAVEGVYRTREFEVLAGEEKTDTVYREHGCTYRLDLAKAYFSPRLSNEHNRIASQVKEGETIIDMFAGIGPFSILIAKKIRNVQVYAIDVNPAAISYLKRNLVLNRVQAKVTPILGEARKVVKEELVGKADRIIMNLPEKAIEYVDASCRAFKPEGGIIHYYEFSRAPNPLETAQNHLIEAVRETPREVKRVLSTRTVREVAPFTWQVVVDAEIQ
jgi:tRNA (guanine37-N1)-methyltransferase